MLWYLVSYCNNEVNLAKKLKIEQSFLKKIKNEITVSLYKQILFLQTV